MGLPTANSPFPVIQEIVPYQQLYYFGDGTAIFVGFGNPNGVVFAGRGSVCLDVSTGDLYVKRLGYASNNGWTISGNISGSTGGLDGQILVADGNGGSTLRASNWVLTAAGNDLENPNIDTRFRFIAGAFLGWEWNALLKQILDATGWAFEQAQVLTWSNTADNPGAAKVATFGQAGGVLTLGGASLTSPGRLKLPRNVIGTLAASQNNWAPTAAYYNLVDASAAVQITGLANGTDGERRVFWYDGANANTQTITWNHNSGSSTAANRFFNSTGANLVMGANAGVEMVYDARMASLAGGWRVSLL